MDQDIGNTCRLICTPAKESLRRKPTSGCRPERRHADQFKEARLAEGVGPAAINRGLAVLRHMFTVAVEQEYLEANPPANYHLLKEVQEPLRIMTYEKYRKLIDAVANQDMVSGAYNAILGETGMRKSEGLRLQ